MNGYDWKSTHSWKTVFRLRAAKARRSNSFSVRPQVERLEDRLVPSTLDLTTAGASGVFNGAVFQQASPQPTGCGVIHDFVRIQAHGAGTTVEQGYNTDARPVQFDEKTSAPFMRSLQLSDVPTVTFDGIVYREFLLGINQKNSQPLLSLDELRIYVGNAPDLTGYDPTTKQLAGLTAVYDMGTDNWVKLDASLTHGNGSGDMFLYVPDSLLSASSNNFVYLYSKFGVNEPVNGGFEQWATPSNATPPPNLSSLSGFVFVDANNDGIFQKGEAPLGGVIIVLTGTNNLGQSVSIQTRTDANGFYSFTNLVAGTYTITEQEPAGFANGQDKDSIGRQGGITGVDQFSNIFLQGGVNGINNNFGELPAVGS
jgi:hypothetical protein